jgi:hypothetical protein
MDSNLIRWQTWAIAMKAGPRVAALVADPPGPTGSADRLIPAGAEIRRRARIAGLSMHQEIAGEVHYQGVGFWLPATADGSAPTRVSRGGMITRAR